MDAKPKKTSQLRLIIEFTTISCLKLLLSAMKLLEEFGVCDKKRNVH